jgi:hypothetical protein
MRGILPPMKRLALIAVAAAIAGCGGTTIDGGQLEDEIVADAEGEGLVLDSVDCPSPDAEEGATFECTVVVKGQGAQLEIEQRNDDGNVEYDLAPLVEGPATSDTAGDEASINFFIDAVRDDVTALCDYATREYLEEITKDQSCAESVLAEYPDEFLGDYEISIDGDHAAVSDGRHTVALERQKNGSWLIRDVR